MIYKPAAQARGALWLWFYLKFPAGEANQAG